MSCNVTLTPGTLPPGFCFQNWQQVLNDFAGNLCGNVIADNLTMSASQPAANRRDRPWINQNDGLLYLPNPSTNSWVSTFPIPPDPTFIGIHIGTEAAVTTLHGGANEPISTTTGPFWEVATQFAARFPVGAGTFAESGTLTSGGIATSTSIEGADKVLITPDNLPEHVHALTKDGEEGVFNKQASSGTGRIDAADSFANPGPITSNVTGVNTTQALKINNLPPFVGVYFIKRTARRFYSIPFV